MDWEEIGRKLSVQNWVILMILGVVSFLLMSPKFTLGLLLGGLIIIANFFLLQRNIRSAFTAVGTLEKGKAYVIGKFYLRFTALAVMIYLLLRQGWVNPIGLLTGLSILIFSIFTIAGRMAWKGWSEGAL